MRNFRSNPAQRRDHYQELTDKIIAALEAGTAPWRRPWDKSACRRSNSASQRSHRPPLPGHQPLRPRNVAARFRPTTRAGAATARRPRALAVRKGEKATPVYFYKPIEIEDKTTDGERETRRIPILRTFSVFHASQIDGIPELAPAVATKAVAERIQDVEIIVQASGVPVRIGGDRAFYNPTFDFIQLPPDEAFHSQELRAATQFMIVTCVGHISRLNRDLSGSLDHRLTLRKNYERN